MTTLFVITLFAGTTLATIVLWGLLLRWGLKRVRASRVTLVRIAGLAALLLWLELTGYALRVSLVPEEWKGLPLDLVGTVALAVVQWVAIVVLFRVGLGRAIKAWLPTLIATVLSGTFALFVVRPYLAQGFVCRSNAMAPTLLGAHWQAVCPMCGEPAYCSPVAPWQYGFTEPKSFICRGNFHVSQLDPASRRKLGADFFLVLKFPEPRRWDVVVFQYPEDPRQLFVMRLVGLPGETVQIKDGRVWVDGRALAGPESLAGITYNDTPAADDTTDDPAIDGPMWGDSAHPAQLGADEYFVLGDFSECSRDSRYWQRSVPGWSPYAVPKQYIRGVATHIYWPPSRWRVLR